MELCAGDSDELTGTTNTLLAVEIAIIAVTITLVTAMLVVEGGGTKGRRLSECALSVT